MKTASYLVLLLVASVHGKRWTRVLSAADSNIPRWKKVFNIDEISASSTCGAIEAFMPLVVGGYNAPEGSAPWQIRLRYIPLHHRHWCGGALISDTWAVTAAHCIRSPYGDEIPASDIQVHLGDYTGAFKPGKTDEYTPVEDDMPGEKKPVPIEPMELYEQIRFVKRIVIHDNFTWKRSSLDNDIALIELDRPVKLNQWIKDVCLPKGPEEDPIPGRYCVNTGWGDKEEFNRQGSERLQEVVLPVVNTEVCNEWFSDSIARINGSLHICAGELKGGKAPCQGDSGGPFVCQRKDNPWVLHGITSFGIGCARVRRPGTFTRISTYLPWIREHIMSVPMETCVDKASWCKSITSYDCADSQVIRSDTCCNSCKKHHIGMSGCEYGDAKSWCAHYTKKDCKIFDGMFSDCCLMCAGQP